MTKFVLCSYVNFILVYYKYIFIMRGSANRSGSYEYYFLFLHKRHDTNDILYPLSITNR